MKIICIQITGLFSIMSSGNFHIVSRFMILVTRHLETPRQRRKKGGGSRTLMLDRRPTICVSVFGYHFYFGAFRIKSIMGDTTLDHDSCYWATVLIDNTGGGELSRGGNNISRNFLVESTFTLDA